MHTTPYVLTIEDMCQQWGGAGAGEQVQARAWQRAWAGRGRTSPEPATIIAGETEHG